MPYKDRTVGLRVFGGLTIALGLCAGLLGVFILLSEALVPAEQRLDLSSLIVAVGVYGIVAIILVVLGIGSIMTKRWARALLLIFSSSWLVLGALDTIITAVILPSALANLHVHSEAPGAPAPSAGVIMAITMAVTLGLLGFIFVILPGIWTFFYYSPHVKATCDARDPQPSWTDACPLPVLAVSLWLWIGVPSMFLMPLSGHFVMPLFGLLLTGLPAALVCFFLGAVWALGGWLVYRVNILGWWFVLVALVLGFTSSIVTFSVHDILDLYRAGNYPQAQIDQIQKLSIFTGHGFVWIMVLMMLPFLGYLIFVRRYFVRRG